MGQSLVSNQNLICDIWLAAPSSLPIDSFTTLFGGLSEIRAAKKKNAINLKNGQNQIPRFGCLNQNLPNVSNLEAWIQMKSSKLPGGKNPAFIQLNCFAWKKNIPYFQWAKTSFSLWTNWNIWRTKPLHGAVPCTSAAETKPSFRDSIRSCSRSLTETVERWKEDLWMQFWPFIKYNSL